MKILYITSDGFDTPSPNNQMAEVMIKEFLDNGYDVHLIQSRRNRVFPEIPEPLKDKVGFSCDIIDRKVFDRRKFVKRYLNDVLFSFSAMRKWRKVKDVDVVYLQSNPTSVYHILLLKIFQRAPVLYTVYDVWPGHAHDIGVIKSKFIYTAFRLLNKLCYKMADHISVMSEDMKKTIIAEGAKENKISIVSAWYDVETTREISFEENKFISKYNISSDKFYVQFAGTIGFVFDCDAVIELAKRLQKETDIVVQIVGDGNVKECFVERVKKEGLNNIEVFPLQPIDLVPHVYSAANIAIIPLRKSVIANSSPSKMPILMACKRVIVTSVDVDSVYAKDLKENKMGFAVDTQDYDGFADTILDLYNSPEKMKQTAENAYSYCTRFLSSDVNTRKYMKIFERIGRKQ